MLHVESYKIDLGIILAVQCVHGFAMLVSFVQEPDAQSTALSSRQLFIHASTHQAQREVELPRYF